MTMSIGIEQEAVALVLAGSGFQPAGDGEEAAIWFERDASQEASDRRVIAPAGEHPWRRAPWPAADALFDLEADGRGVLVVGDDRGIAKELAGRPLQVSSAPRLDLAQLEKAAVVVLTQETGAALPAEAPAVLAAGRVLVTTPCDPLYGLRPGIDHVSGDGAEEIADLATSATLHWEAFGSMRTYARIAAERHRASRVLSDLMLDVELGL